MMVYHKFQSLIGNVQQKNEHFDLVGDITFQSLIGNVQPKAKRQFNVLLAVSIPYR